MKTSRRMRVMAEYIRQVDAGEIQWPADAEALAQRLKAEISKSAAEVLAATPAPTPAQLARLDRVQTEMVIVSVHKYLDASRPYRVAGGGMTSGQQLEAVALATAGQLGADSVWIALFESDQ